MDERNKYVLSWGIHRGTMLSRDVGDNYLFDTKEQLDKKWEKLKKWFTGPAMNCKIWFASYKAPNSDDFIEFDHGEGYI